MFNNNIFSEIDFAKSGRNLSLFRFLHVLFIISVTID